MASDATKEAKLVLKIETGEATREVRELKKEAEAAQKVLDRHGSAELARPEMSTAEIKQSRAAAAQERRFSGRRAVAEANRLDSIEAEHAEAEKRLSQYRLNKHYQEARQSRAAEESARNEKISRYESHIDAGRASSAKYESEIGAARLVKSGGGGAHAGLAGRAAGLAAGALAAATTAVVMGRIASVHANTDLSESQKSWGTLAQIPVLNKVASEFQEFLRNITGANEAMRQIRQQMERDNAIRPGHWQNEAMRVTYASQASVAARQYQSIRGSQVPAIGETGFFAAGGQGRGGWRWTQQYDRSTVAGERGYQEELLRLPGIDASMDAERQAAAAGRTLGDERGTLGRIESAREAARHRQERAMGRHASLKTGEKGLAGRNQIARQNALTEWNAANIDVAALDQQRLQQIERVRDAAVNAAQAEAQARQRNIDLMRTELSIQENRTNRLINAAQTFGAMNPLEQALAANALRAVRDRGVRGVTPEVLARARALNPEFVGMAQRNRAETEPLFQELRNEGLLAEGVGGSIGQNQAITEQMRQQIREQTLESQERLAAAVSEALGSTFERILTTFRDRMTALENQFQQGLQNQFNAQN